MGRGKPQRVEYRSEDGTICGAMTSPTRKGRDDIVRRSLFRMEHHRGVIRVQTVGARGWAYYVKHLPHRNEADYCRESDLPAWATFDKES